MERRRARAARAAPGDIPAGYLDSVAVREYHLEINLAVERRSFSGRVRIPVEIRAGPARRNFYLHAAARLQLTGAKVGGVPGVLFRDRATRIEVPEEAAVPRGASTVIEVCFAGEISNWRTDGLYMGCGKPGVPGKGSGAREEEAQAEAEQRGAGRGDGGERAADASGNGEEAAAAAATATAASAKTSRGSNSDDSDTSPSLVFAPGAVLGTHLEPTHARELFPCVDLPRAKAVFKLTLRGIPAHLQAISNTPVLRTEIDEAATLPAAGDGSRPAPLKSVYFQQTPVMPTYIFGFWVGDFCSISTRALATTAVCGSDSPSQPQQQPSPSPQQPRPSAAACSGRGDTIEINVHVVRGVGLESAEFALDFARRAFELFARLFSVRFPMSKLDLIALPQMNGLGMENFGAITCLQEYLLVTADTSFVRRRRIARLICHEVSHMWYGDIVTPESFDELWLKEGMARFFEYLAVESLDSSYHVWNNFMTEVFVQAMLSDSQENSHPVVQQHNGDIASILDSFDTITYCKGASILRMLSHCVGLDRFLRGMGDYVASHQYGCATQEDLWDAVQGVCDQDGVAVNVRDLMQPWLTRPRFPVLRVRMTGNTLSISQQPFSLFAVPGVGAAGGPGSTAAEAAAVRAAGRKGASEAAVARSTKLPRRGGPTAPEDGRSSVPPPADGEPPVGAGSGAAEGAASGCPVSAEEEEEEGSGVSRPARSNASDPDSEGSESAGCCWVVPLRIRVGRGPRSVQEGGGREVEGARLRRSSVSAERPGEVTHSLFLAEAQTSVTLRGLSCELAAGAPVAADAGSDVADGDQGRGGKGRPYLVVNDGHSGFFTVQYECERSWGLALAAVEQGVLNECETMGFVHDLMLALHKGVLVDRRAASVSITGLLGGGVNRSRSDCGGVPCLFSRLRELVRLLRRDRSNPAWSTGQLFVWELLVMCASNALGEAFSLSRRQRELSLARKRAQDSPVPRKGVTGSPTLAPGPLPTGTDGVARAGTGDEGDVSGRTAAECRAGAGSCEGPSSHAPSTDSCSSETTEGNRRATAAVAAAAGAAEAEAEAAESRSRTENEMKAAAGRLRSVTAATEVAVKEVGGHVEWHTDRVRSGEEQAEEALQSLRAMKERLERNRAQLAWAKQHELLRAFA